MKNLELKMHGNDKHWKRMLFHALQILTLPFVTLRSEVETTVDISWPPIFAFKVACIWREKQNLDKITTWIIQGCQVTISN